MSILATISENFDTHSETESSHKDSRADSAVTESQIDIALANLSSKCEILEFGIMK